MAKEKENIEDKAEETIDDLVEESSEEPKEEFIEEDQEKIVSVSSEPTILSEETEETQLYDGQEQRVVSTTESELEETASEANPSNQKNIEYEVGSHLSTSPTREDKEVNINYEPDKLYDSSYKPSDGLDKKEKKEDEKIYITKRERING